MTKPQTPTTDDRPTRSAGPGSLVIGIWSLVILLPSAAHGHPVPRSEHDRNVTVTWRPDGVFVKYRLEIDEYTLPTSVARWIADQPGAPRKPIGPKEIAN